MNGFDDYGGFSPIERDPTLDSVLKNCKTDEEREKVVDEYLAMKVKFMVIGVVAFILVMVLIALIVFLF